MGPSRSVTAPRHRRSPDGVQHDDGEHDDAGDEILKLLAEAAQQQHDLDDGDDGDADQRPHHRAGAALDAGAADQHGGDRGVVVAGAELHVARAVARGEQHARHRRAGAGDDVGDGDRACGVDAGGDRGARIAADHHHVAADPRPRQDELPDHHRGEEIQRLDRDAGEPALEHLQALAARIDALAAGRQRRAADQQRQAGDADQDRIGADVADQEALRRRDDDAERDGDQECRQDAERQAGQEHQRRRRHGGAEAERHDVAGQRDEGHADGDAADEGDGVEQRVDAERRGEARRRQRKECNGSRRDDADAPAPNGGAREGPSCRCSRMGDVGQHARHVGLAAPVGGDLAAAIHADDDVGHAEHLLDVGGRHDEAIAAVAELPDQPVDFGAGADIDAAGRLVHQQHAGRVAVAADRAAEGELLLVAAAQFVGLASAAAPDRRRPPRQAWRP